MKQLHHFVQEMRAKPEHIRKRYVAGISTGATAVIAFFWLVASASSGTFALEQKNGEQGSLTAVSSSANASAAAAAEAALSVPRDETPTLTIVETNAPKLVEKSTTTPDVIPF